MSNLKSKQICPHCEYEVDDSQAEWDEGHHHVTCVRCGKDYIVVTHYKFEGFEVGKECDWCGEIANELSHPHMFDPALGKGMCRGCWDHDREVYKGSYGEDIGEFKPIRKGVPG